LFSEEPMFTVKLLNFELIICYYLIKNRWKWMHIPLPVLVDQAVEPVPQRKEAARPRYWLYAVWP
jgi:hypothetical protein